MLCISFSFCSQEQSAKQTYASAGVEESMKVEYSEAGTIIPPSTKEAQAPKPPEAKIIKKGQLRYEVDSLSIAKLYVDTLLGNAEGQYENEQYFNESHSNRYELKIRVPNHNFDDFIQSLERSPGQLKSKHISAIDVGEEFWDLNIRLKSNLAFLDQYRSLLKKAKSIEDILEIQERIRYITTEIESQKGRLKYLQNQVSYSTVDLEIYEPKHVAKIQRTGFFKKLLNAFEGGFEGFQAFIIGLIYIWPFLLLIALLVVFRKRIFKIFKANKPKDN